MQSLTISSPEQSQWWRLPRVIAETGLSRSTIYRLMDRGDFPANKPMRSARAKVWFESEVRAWKAKEVAQVVEGELGDLL